MTEPAPAPLVAADVDCRGLPFMPLDVVRLMDSDLFALSTGDEFKAAVALWCKSWVQVPAGSLPDDDRVLAHLSAAGPRWRKVKEMALRGWRKCSDGRLYHGVVCEKAAEAWERRQSQRSKAARRWDRGGNPGALPEAQPAGNAAARAAEPPAARAAGDAAADPTAMQGTGTGTGKRQAAAAPDVRDEPPPDPRPPGLPAARPSPLAMPADAAAEHAQRTVVGERVLDAARIDRARWMGNFALISAWLSAGYDPELDILPAVVQCAARPGYQPPRSLGYFTSAIEEHWRQRALDIPAMLRRPPPAPQRTRAERRWDRAMTAWIDGGRNGPEPRREDFEDAA